MEQQFSVGEWKKERELGSGGFGVVDLWVNKVTREQLAIKRCRWAIVNSLSVRQRERWTSEVKMMQDTRHDNIVAYCKMPTILEEALAKANPSKLPILSMEYCAMGNLRTHLSLPHNVCGFGEMQVIEILKDVSSALQYLHDCSITHRDFKPENVVLQQNHTRRSGIVYKIIDLGYAKEIGDATVSFVGTMQYLAPEIFEQKNYDASVDYWSLGITAFEIICGFRPFLPSFSPFQSFQYVKCKDADVICLHFTHTGDIKSSKELPQEIHISSCLKQNIEKWLRSVLQYNPEQRGLIDNNNLNVFQSLQDVLTKKIITVFSVYTYEFYSYEIDNSTLYTTLEDWIARDIKIHKVDMSLISCKNITSNFAVDYYEASSQAMLFVFKKGAFIREHVAVPFPKLVLIMFEKISTEYKFNTFKLLHNQVLYFISQEMKYLNTLKNGIYFLCEFLKSAFINVTKLLTEVTNSLRTLLSEIEFYNNIEKSLCAEIYINNNNPNLCEYLLDYQRCLQQLLKIISTVNELTARHEGVGIQHYKLHLSANIVFDVFKKHDMSPLADIAKTHHKRIVDTKPSCMTVSREIVTAVSKTIKLREVVLKNDLMLHFIRAAMSQAKELNKLLSCLIAVQDNLAKIKENLRKNNIERLQIVKGSNKSKKSHNISNINCDYVSLMNENIHLRYLTQEFMSSSCLNYSNSLKEISKTNSIEN